MPSAMRLNQSQIDPQADYPWGSHTPLKRVLGALFTLVLLLCSTSQLVQQNQKHDPPRPNTRHLKETASVRPSKFSADSSNPKVLNVHVVPHTHDDVGWLKTVEQYYFGLNMTIQHASVHDIIDSVVAALLDDHSRTFTYVEMKFFSMWWERQTDAVRDSVRFLVANKQLNFVNGGWCMHDEAATHYMGMIDQTTLGHSFLMRELGVIPRVGWQLDPFGHSATQASLLTSRVGFNALYFGRIDYQDLRIRQLEKECEGLWNSSKSWNDTTVFWGLTGSYGGNYGAPSGFCFDVNCKDPKPVGMNNTALFQSVEKFLRLLRVQSDRTKGNHIMLTMGSDFQYQRASLNFANIDAVLGAVKNLQRLGKLNIATMFGPRFDRVNLFFSSPEYYTKCKFDETQSSAAQSKDESNVEGNAKLSIKRDDFFPYSDCEHCFWTGYLTSRAGFKRLERVASSFLLAARQIESMLDYTGNVDPFQCEKPFHELEDASGVAQHHDGVSGTAKQHVANDYSKRLQRGIDGVSGCAVRKVRRLLLGSNASDYLKDLSQCQLLNETICEVSQKATEKNGTNVYVVVYNGLGTSRSTVVHLPVSSDGTYHIAKVGGSATEATVVPSSLSSTGGAENGATYVVHFDTGPLPPLGANVYNVTLEGNAMASMTVGHTDRVFIQKSDHRRVDDLVPKDKDVMASNGIFSVLFDGVTGGLKQMNASGITLVLKQTWGYYTSFDNKVDQKDEKDNQNSGAYIFRPSVPEQELIEVKPSSARFLNTSVGMEVQVEYNEPWIKTTTRVMTGLPYLEIEYTIGPIPIDDQRGKEVVTRFLTPIQSSSTFYTDSNGREFQQRKRNYRPTWELNVFEPVSGNYYPVNTAMYIEDDDSGKALAVSTDRTQGGSSLVDGSVELMVHRRTLADDSRGVGEALNETDGGITACPPYGNATRIGKGIVVRGTLRILIGGEGGATLARSMMDGSFADPVVFVGSSIAGKDVPFRVSNFSGLDSDLPPNVMLITRSMLYNEPGTTFLIRLGHQYGDGEDKNLSKAAEVDLAVCVPGFSIVGVVEVTLSGNQDYSAWLANRFAWSGGESEGSESGSLNGTKVQLNPMDIRTFKVSVNVSGI